MPYSKNQEADPKNKVYRHHKEFSPHFDIKTVKEEKVVFFQGAPVLTLTSAKTIHNQHQGTCYLIASGPSLKKFDDHCLKTCPAFYMNGSIQKFKNDNKQAFYTADDPSFFEHRMDCVLQGLESASVCFLSAIGLNHICNYDPSVLYKKKVVLIERVNRFYGKAIQSSRRLFGLRNLFERSYIYNSYNPLSKNFGRIGFSLDIEKGIFGARTIAYHTLQIAYYLGFRKIYIAGMDLSYKGKASRFYEQGKNAQPSTLLDDYERHILPSFTVASKMVKKGMVDIINLSETSRLPTNIIPIKRQSTYEPKSSV